MMMEQAPFTVWVSKDFHGPNTVDWKSEKSGLDEHKF